jgi:hypothetical protein
MWHRLTVMLFLVVLAQTANALPIHKTLDDAPLASVEITQVEQQSASIFDKHEPENLFNLPSLHRLSPSLFSAEIQTTPSYVLLIEFFKIKLTAGLYKNLINPPLMTHWFEQLSHKAKSSRISGWKDGNFLYSSRTTYYS